MEGYQIGKEVAAINNRLAYLEQAVNDIALVIKANIDSNVLKEPPKKEEETKE